MPKKKGGKAEGSQQQPAAVSPKAAAPASTPSSETKRALAALLEQFSEASDAASAGLRRVLDVAMNSDNVVVAPEALPFLTEFAAASKEQRGTRDQLEVLAKSVRASSVSPDRKAVLSSALDVALGSSKEIVSKEAAAVLGLVFASVTGRAALEPVQPRFSAGTCAAVCASFAAKRDAECAPAPERVAQPAGFMGRHWLDLAVRRMQRALLAPGQTAAKGKSAGATEETQGLLDLIAQHACSVASARSDEIGVARALHFLTGDARPFAHADLAAVPLEVRAMVYGRAAAQRSALAAKGASAEDVAAAIRFVERDMMPTLIVFFDTEESGAWRVEGLVPSGEAETKTVVSVTSGDDSRAREVASVVSALRVSAAAVLVTRDADLTAARTRVALLELTEASSSGPAPTGEFPTHAENPDVKKADAAAKGKKAKEAKGEAKAEQAGAAEGKKGKGDKGTKGGKVEAAGDAKDGGKEKGKEGGKGSKGGDKEAAKPADKGAKADKGKAPAKAAASPAPASGAASAGPVPTATDMFVRAACRNILARAEPQGSAAASSQDDESAAPALPLEERIALALSVGEECINPDELQALLTRNPHPICYDGFEPSGRMHIAQGVLKSILVNKLTQAGCTFVFWVADWFALLNDKMGGDLAKIRIVGEYMIEVWRACGMDMRRVKFLWAADEINKRPNEYWLTVMDIARTFSITRVKRCGQIMGREESDANPSAQILYPAMQCADIFFLKADICQLGLDQRKVNMLAREYAQHKKMPHPPIILSHHMLMGLTGEKMSKTDPDAAIFMEDTQADILRKVKKAFCEPGNVEKNPVLDYCKHILFPKNGAFTIARPEKYGGDMHFATYDDLHAAFAKGDVHPGDLKPAVANAIDALVAPVRQHFERDERAASLFAQVRSFRVTK